MNKNSRLPNVLFSSLEFAGPGVRFEMSYGPVGHKEYIQQKYLGGSVEDKEKKVRKRKVLKAATKHQK